MERDLDYEENNIGFDEYYKHDGIKCKNYEVCETILLKEHFQIRGNYLCTPCHIMFGTWSEHDENHTGKGILEIYNNKECCVCLEKSKSISHPNCDHTSCIECFKRLYYGNPEYRNIDKIEPKNPYPEIESDYDIYDEDCCSDPKWNKPEYTELIEYRKQHKIWETLYDTLYDERENEIENLSKCPLCRK